MHKMEQKPTPNLQCPTCVCILLASLDHRSGAKKPLFAEDAPTYHDVMPSISLLQEEDIVLGLHMRL